MAAQIPIKNDPAANEAAIEKVRTDKIREASDGCDGTWVAHPGLVPVARAVFDQYIGSWLVGNGCVPVYNLMEDAATAEISRSQIWQWMRSPKGVLDDDRSFLSNAPAGGVFFVHCRDLWHSSSCSTNPMA